MGNGVVTGCSGFLLLLLLLLLVCRVRERKIITVLQCFLVRRGIDNEQFPIFDVQLLHHFVGDVVVPLFASILHEQAQIIEIIFLV